MARRHIRPRLRPQLSDTPHPRHRGSSSGRGTPHRRRLRVAGHHEPLPDRAQRTGIRADQPARRHAEGLGWPGTDRPHPAGRVHRRQPPHPRWTVDLVIACKQGSHYVPGTFEVLTSAGRRIEQFNRSYPSSVRPSSTQAGAPLGIGRAMELAPSSSSRLAAWPFGRCDRHGSSGTGLARLPRQTRACTAVSPVPAWRGSTIFAVTCPLQAHDGALRMGGAPGSARCSLTSRAGSGVYPPIRSARPVSRPAAAVRPASAS